MYATHMMVFTERGREREREGEREGGREGLSSMRVALRERERIGCIWFIHVLSATSAKALVSE